MRSTCSCFHIPWGNFNPTSNRVKTPSFHRNPSIIEAASTHRRFPSTEQPRRGPSNLTYRIDSIKESIFCQVEGISQFSPDPRRRRVNKVYLKCDMCKDYCVLNVDSLNDTYEDDINNAGGMLPWCLPKLIIETYLEEHIFKNLKSVNPECVPVSNTATHSWNTN